MPLQQTPRVPTAIERKNSISEVLNDKQPESDDVRVEQREMNEDEVRETMDMLDEVTRPLQENITVPGLKNGTTVPLDELLPPKHRAKFFGNRICTGVKVKTDPVLNAKIMYIFEMNDGTKVQIQPNVLAELQDKTAKKPVNEEIATALEAMSEKVEEEGIKPAFSPEQVAEVAKVLEDAKGEVDQRMQEIIDSTEVNPDAELESKEVNVPIGGDPLHYAITEDDEGVHIDLDLLASEYPDAEVREVDYESDRVKDSILGKATGTFNLPDEEAFEFYLLIKDYKKGLKKKVKMADLPMTMRQECARQVQEIGGTIGDYDMFAQLLVQTFVSEVEQNEVFIDIEKELDEALKIPSVMDMFFEHSNKMAHEHIPEMIAKCEEAGDTERAELLRRVGQAIDDAFSMKPLIEYYKSSSRTRKACRRDTDKVKKYLNLMNYNNEKTKFKMQDATGMLTAMSKVFIEDAIQQTGKATFTEDQIIKFVILVCSQCSAMDPNSIVSATYMYYLMKNVITLTYVEEAKTDFARQLIDNISDVMSTIIDEEAEFYAANPKREGKQKRSKRDKR